MLKTSEIKEILSRKDMPKLENILTPHLITKVNTIYKIGCKCSNKCYIGQTSKMTIERWQEHLRDLRKGTHHSHKLQRAYNKYGENSFTFEVMECTLKAFLNDKEIYWIDYFDSYYNGYNETLGGDGADAKPVYCYGLKTLKLVKTYPSRNSVEEDGFDKEAVSTACNKKGDYKLGIYKNLIWSYKPLTNEQLKAIKSQYEEKQKAISEKRSEAMNRPEVRAKMAVAKKGENNPMKRPDVRAKKSESMKGKPSPMKGKTLSAETRAKMAVAKKGKPSPMKGKTLSEETKAKMQKISNAQYIQIAESVASKQKTKTEVAIENNVDKATIGDMFNYKYCRKSCREAIIELCKKYNYPMRGLEKVA